MAQPTTSSPAFLVDGPVPYRIRGHDIQTVEFLPETGDRIIAQRRTFVCAAGGLSSLHVSFGRRIMDPFLRKWSGEATILEEIMPDQGPALVVLGAHQIGKIVRVPLRGGRSLICQRGAFIAATGSIDIGIAIVKRLRVGMLGGQGLIFQKISGDGDVFLHAAGNVVDWVLPDRAMVRATAQNVLAFDESVGYDIQATGGLLTWMSHTESAVLAQLEGPGRVVFQSMGATRPIDPKHAKHGVGPSEVEPTPKTGG